MVHRRMGHYEPLADLTASVLHKPGRGLLIVLLALLAWAPFVLAGYLFWTSISR
jgi:hypothetical protein